MAVEREFKFSLTSEAAVAIAGHLALAGKPRMHEPRTSYFDTPDRDIWRAGFSLRVREADGRYMQTVKRLGGAAVARGEWESPIAGGKIDADALAPTPLAELRPSKLAAARRVFVTRIERRTWLHESDGGAVEIALDRGEIVAGRRRLAVVELELELKSGAPSALINLARELVDAAPLRLAFDSKAERGWRLPRAPSSNPGAGRRRDLDPDAGRRKLPALARSALGPGRRQPRGARQVRDRRRCTRRAWPCAGCGQCRRRSARRPNASRRIEAEIKWLAGELDCVRDLDVFARETFLPRRGLSAMKAWLASVTGWRGRGTAPTRVWRRRWRIGGSTACSSRRSPGSRRRKASRRRPPRALPSPPSPAERAGPAAQGRARARARLRRFDAAAGTSCASAPSACATAPIPSPRSSGNTPNAGVG